MDQRDVTVNSLTYDDDDNTTTTTTTTS